MSIKSDDWIRRMADSHGMIEPFEPGQVRTANGGRIVSYGTSSYGYDVRCATEFKIFTNINSTIVDPKAFDAKNFVDVDADVCIIPPNSFALARTGAVKTSPSGMLRSPSQQTAGMPFTLKVRSVPGETSRTLSVLPRSAFSGCIARLIFA